MGASSNDHATKLHQLSGVTVENIPPGKLYPGMFWHTIVCQIIPPLQVTGVWKCNF